MNSKLSGKDILFIFAPSNELDISFNADKQSTNYAYEQKAVYIYDIITKQNCAKKELSNKPIIS